jgi:protoporphyrinogen oxidase
VNTLKKIKAASGLLGCKVRVQSSGFTLQNTKERHSQQEEAFSYSFGKQFNRYFKRKLVQKLAACETANLSLHNAMGREVEQMEDAIKLNKNSH